MGKWMLLRMPVMILVATITLSGKVNQSMSLQASASDSQSPRMGSATLALKDENGATWSDAIVQYQQTTHDFLFGIGMTSPHGSVPLGLYKGLAQNGLNYALTFMPWGWLEPERGRYAYARVDDFSHIAEMKQLGYTLNGHGMIFFLPDHPEDVPPYLLSMEFPQLKEAVYNHSFAVAEHYRDTITYWTINEPSWFYGDAFRMSSEEWLEIVRAASQAIRKADPQARIMVNFPPRDVPDINYFPLKFLDALQREGIEIDVIGVELYPAFFNKKDLDTNGYPKISWVSSRLEEFAHFNKPIILSEVGVPDKPSPQAQAEWLRDFYAMVFEKPYVIGITWYFIDDDPFLPGGGLFPEFDSPPRPVQQALADFISDKTTNGTTNTDLAGNAKIEGYAGDYLVQIGDGNSVASFTIHIAEQEDCAFTVQINDRNQAAIAQVTLTPSPMPSPTSTITLTASVTPTTEFTPTPAKTITITPIAPGIPIQGWKPLEIAIAMIVLIGLAFGIFFIIRRRR